MAPSMVFKKTLFPVVLFVLFYYLYDAFKSDYTEIFKGSAINSPINIHTGDSSIWSSPKYDDSHWGTDLPSVPYMAWMRIWVDLKPTQIKDAPVGVGVWAYTGSYELYWDGNFIGTNGIPGIGTKEIEGQIDKVFNIPDSLMKAGLHLIAMRASQQQSKNLSTFPYIIVESYDRQNKSLIIIAAFIHIFTGAFLIISIYYFLIYFKSYRQKIFLLFGIICLTLFISSLLQYVKFYYKYPYPFHVVRRAVTELFTITIGISLAAYFLLLYKVRRPFYYLLGLSIVYAVTYFLFDNREINFKIYLLFIESILFSFLLTIWAVFKNKKDSISSLYSLISPFTLMFFLELYFYELMFYLSFFILIVFNLFTLSKKIGEQKKNYEKYLIESNRLKVELLKKNIQPHFIMNTLTSLISWVEESPTVAVKFIEALAEEFRILVEIAELNCIPISTEIKLCETHLKIMSYRHDVEYRLNTIDITPGICIPPAIFLTMLENGITHNVQNTNIVIFEFQQINHKHAICYRFFSPGFVSNYNSPIQDGTGMKYIKARLNELYGENWELENYHPVQGWEIRITIFNKR